MLNTAMRLMVEKAAREALAMSGNRRAEWDAQACP